MTCNSFALHLAILALSANLAEALTSPAVQQNGRARTLIETKGQANVLANNRRFYSEAVFMAGLEGTMHHFWLQIHEACVKAGKCQMMNQELTHAVWFERSNLSRLEDAWSSMRLTPRGKRLMLIHPQMMLSYPNGDPFGEAGTFGYPRLDNYFLAAQRNSDVLKIVVLLRDGNASYASSHFRMGHGARALIDGANIMNNQLLRLPREATFMCMNSEQMPLFGRQFELYLGMDEYGSPYFHYQNAMRKIWFNSKVVTCGKECHIPELEEAVERTREICKRGSVGPTIGRNVDITNDHISNILHFAFG